MSVHRGLKVITTCVNPKKTLAKVTFYFFHFPTCKAIASCLNPKKTQPKYVIFFYFLLDKIKA